MGAAAGLARPIVRPAETVRSFIEFPFALATRPGEVISQTKNQALNNPTGFIGEQVGNYYFFKGIGVAGRKVANTYKAAGAEFVPAEKVFDVPSLNALQGKAGQTFPKASSAKNALEKFEIAREGDMVGVSHATSGMFKKSTVTQEAPRAYAEDTGLYVTPKGQGSPYFLRTQSGTEYRFSLNPFADAIKNPTVVNVAVKDVKRLPRGVLETQGFEQSNAFIRSQAGSGNAFITKRSEIGYDRLAGGGRISQANQGLLSTTELEAVIPPNTKLQAYVPEGTFFQRFKGYKQYTVVDDYVVPLKEYRIVGEGSGFGKVTTSERVAKNVFDSQSSLQTRYRTIPPYSFRSPSYRGGSYILNSGRYPYRSSQGSSSLFDARSDYSVTSYRGGTSSIRSPIIDRTSRNNRNDRGGYGSSRGYSFDYSRTSDTLYSITSSKKIVPPPTTLPKLFDGSGPSTRSRKVADRQTPFNPKYVASIEATVFKIKGRASKVNVASGLGLRPIKR